MTRVFVSGAAGVIGSSLIPKLISQGHIVLGGDLKPRPDNFHASVEYIQGDLNNLSLDVLSEFRPEAFIHLAASFERSVESSDFWADNFSNNVRLSHHLGSLAISSGSLEKVINASSYLVYDSFFYLTNSKSENPYSLQERSAVHPRNLVGSAKYFHELELEFLERTNEAPVSITNARIFRGYGCGSRDVISRWVRSLVAGEPISVYGKEGAFDFVFAEDSAEGLLRMMDNGNLSTTLNLGSGISRSIGEIIGILKKHFPNAIIFEGKQVEQIERSVANISKLEKTLGWRPSFTLEQGIDKIVSFEKLKMVQVPR